MASIQGVFPGHVSVLTYPCRDRLIAFISSAVQGFTLGIFFRVSFGSSKTKQKIPDTYMVNIADIRYTNTLKTFQKTAF